jgi:hypothetical protein
VCGAWLDDLHGFRLPIRKFFSREPNFSDIILVRHDTICGEIISRTAHSHAKPTVQCQIGQRVNWRRLGAVRRYLAALTVAQPQSRPLFHRHTCINQDRCAGHIESTITSRRER